MMMMVRLLFSQVLALSREAKYNLPTRAAVAALVS